MARKLVNYFLGTQLKLRSSRRAVILVGWFPALSGADAGLESPGNPQAGKQRYGRLAPIVKHPLRCSGSTEPNRTAIPLAPKPKKGSSPGIGIRFSPSSVLVFARSFAAVATPSTPDRHRPLPGESLGSLAIRLRQFQHLAGVAATRQSAAFFARKPGSWQRD